MMTEITAEFLRPLLLRREPDSHKGDYGHLLLVCGCRAMPGAAVLATGAALKSGCGLVTLHSTESALQAAACNYPSAMLSADPGDCLSLLPERLERFSAIAVGPGLGRAPQTAGALAKLLLLAGEAGIPLVLDADALNILSARKAMLEHIPSGSVMTPHEGELRRLLGDAPDDETVLDFCKSIGCVLVRKGYHTRIYTPEGEMLVNTTGNPGLAKGGSGDVLTGLLGGLMARGYAASEAASFAVWIHGYAGDCLAAERTAESWNSRDLIDALYQGFRVLY